MAASRYYYLVTSLPTLGDLGTAPPLTPGALLDRARDEGGVGELVEAVFLGDDLLQRESVLAGDPEPPEPAVLSREAVRGEAPLPEVLEPSDSAAPGTVRVPSDALWASYYRYLDRVAREQRSEFLQAFVAFEVGLRNALAIARAKALGLEPTDYLVVPELGDDPADHDSAVAEWASAPDPLSALRTLDRIRWDWITEYDAWFTFGQDEIAAYAVRLMLLTRWDRLDAAAQKLRGEPAP